MLPERYYKAVLSVSVSPEQRERFYTSLAQFRQQAPFVTKSALVVQAVIQAAEQERLLLELLARLPQTVHITRDGPMHRWQCAGGQGSAAVLLQAVQEALTALLGAPTARSEHLPVPAVARRDGQAQPEGGTTLDETSCSDQQP